MNLNSKLLDKQKIFDDHQSLLKEKSKNIIIQIYKGLILSFFALTFLILLFTSKNTIFGKNILNKSLYHFLDFSQLEYEQKNWILLFRMFTLGFVYFYSVTKAYLSISKNKENIKIYSIWFSLYWAMSLTAFILFLKFENIKANKVINLLFLLLPLLAIDISFSLFSFFTKKKLQPIIYDSKWPLIVDILSRTTLVVIVFAVFFKWVNSGGNHYVMLTYNSFYNTIFKLLKMKNFTNFILILLIFIIFGLLIIGLNIYPIWTLANKQLNIETFRDRIIFYLVGLGIIFIWLLSLFSLKIPIENIFITTEKLNYLSLLFGLLNIAMLTLYLTITYTKKLKTNSSFIKTLYLTAFQWVIWNVFLLAIFLTSNSVINIINLLITISVSLIMFYFYVKKTKNISLNNILFITFNILLILAVSIIFGINQNLLSENNKILYTFNSKLSFMQIITLIIILFQTIFMVYTLVHMFIIMKKASLLNVNDSRKDKNEKI